MEEETAAAEKAVKVLGKQIDSIIKSGGSRPQMITRLPKAGLKSNSIRYLHHPVILNYHYYLADENTLNLSSRSEAVLAAYQRNKENALLLLIIYAGPEAVRAAYAGFRKYYIPDADQADVALLEDNTWAAVSVKDRMLIIILESDSRRLAESLLDELTHTGRLNP